MAIVAMGKARPLLLGHRNSDGTAAAGHLPIATEGYGPLLQRRIVVVVLLRENSMDLIPNAPASSRLLQIPHCSSLLPPRLPV
jgi:hypothetical protein